MAVMNAHQSPVTSHTALRQQRLDVQLRQLEFNALLHRKLDLERLFECLLTEGQAFVPFDGLQFLAAERGADIMLGFSRQHRQRFELKLGERSLGEIILMQAMDDLLPREIRLARRVEQPLSVILISVDYLESITEHHGTQVGEQAWQSVAETLAARLRESDLIFRTERDEFCIVLNHNELNGAMALAERLRQEVDRCVSYDNVQYVLTASAGVTELGMSDDSANLLTRAGEALSLARTAGRNQVCALPPKDPTDGFDPTAA